MLSLCFIILNVLNVFPQSSYKSTYTINVVYPWEGKNIGNVYKSFVFGNINPLPSTFTVNDQPVTVYKNGSFIAYVAVSTEDPSFVINADGYIYKRNVVSSDNLKKIDYDNPVEVIKTTYVYISKGSDYCLSFRGTANSSIRIGIKDIAEDIIKDDGKGNFEYCFNVPYSVKDVEHDLIVKYVDGSLKGKKYIYRSFLRVFDGYYNVETSTDNVVLKNSMNGYIMFLPQNISLYCDMCDSSRCRAVFNSMKLYVDLDKVLLRKIVKKIAPAKVSTVRFIRTSSNRIMAKIYISNRVPFSVWEEEKKLNLELYNSIPNINWIVYDPKDDYTSYLVFRQISENSTLLSFNFKNSDLWGYKLNYSTESTLDIEFKFKPFIPSMDIPQPLKGLNIIIDPGHSPKNEPPYDGAVGPSGSYEYVVNLEIAKKLYNKLVSYGANVFMTRYTTNPEENIPLSERPRIARKIDGDLFISIHNNALADGEDPYAKPRGFQIYYYHLHSKKLAESVHQSFVRNIPLPDEGLRYGDYMVARIHQMPSILVENAYLILPEHEEMLKDPVWQDRFASAIFEGIVDFLRR